MGIWGPGGMRVEGVGKCKRCGMSTGSEVQGCGFRWHGVWWVWGVGVQGYKRCGSLGGVGVQFYSTACGHI